jgi:uncharacterized protein YjiS (DUF1127 family)
MRASASLAHALGGITLRGLGKLTALLDARRNRRPLVRLDHWDDRMLKDVGLTRTNIEDASAGRNDPWALLRRTGR